MVKLGFRLSLCLLLCLSSFVNAAESSQYAHRAQKQLQLARYPEALQLLSRALKASAKEANIASEQRILLSMARVYFLALDTNSLNIVLNKIQASELDQNSKYSYALLKMEIANANLQGSHAIDQISPFLKSLAKHDDDNLVGTLLLEYSLAKAITNQPYDSLFEEALDLLDDEAPGRVAWTKARIFEFEQKDSLALQQYQEAFKSAQNKGLGAFTGLILIKIAHLQSKQKNENAKSMAGQTWIRAIRLYEQLRLEYPLLHCADELIKLDEPIPDDIAMLVALIRKQISPTTISTP